MSKRMRGSTYRREGVRHGRIAQLRSHVLREACGMRDPLRTTLADRGPGLLGRPMLGPATAHVVESHHRLDVGTGRAVAVSWRSRLGLFVVELKRAFLPPVAGLAEHDVEALFEVRAPIVGSETVRTTRRALRWLAELRPQESRPNIGSMCSTISTPRPASTSVAPRACVTQFTYCHT
ncbi:MAG: hypothetical protein LC808_34810 [Actinobacteria bacterium]|nr:hypothetical protein [Actinomycetota bacterium]